MFIHLARDTLRMTVMFMTFQSLTLSSPKKMVSAVSLSGEAVWTCCHRLKKNQNSQSFRQIVHKKRETLMKETAVISNHYRGHILLQPRLCVADKVSPHLRQHPRRLRRRVTVRTAGNSSQPTAYHPP